MALKNLVRIPADISKSNRDQLEELADTNNIPRVVLIRSIISYVLTRPNLLTEIINNVKANR